MKISTHFDDELNVWVVAMPEFVSFDVLEAWGFVFFQGLETRSQRAGLLLDTHRHNFESIACLKLLRELLVGACGADQGGIDRIAVVAPVNCRKPEVVSAAEGYFSDIAAARRWLAQP